MGFWSHFDTKAEDGADKYFQIGSSYYFPQSESEKQIRWRGRFYLQLLRLFAFRDLLQPFNRPEQLTLLSFPSQPQMCD